SLSLIVRLSRVFYCIAVVVHRSVLHVLRPPPSSTLFPYTTLFRSQERDHGDQQDRAGGIVRAHDLVEEEEQVDQQDRVGEVHERSEEHTSELQSRFDLVCRLLLEKKKKTDSRGRFTVRSGRTWRYD